MKSRPFRRSKSFLRKLKTWGRLMRLVKPKCCNWPWAPRFSRLFSKTVTWWPPSFSSMANRRPTGPPPTTKTFCGITWSLELGRSKCMGSPWRYAAPRRSSSSKRRQIRGHFQCPPSPTMACKTRREKCDEFFNSWSFLVRLTNRAFPKNPRSKRSLKIASFFRNYWKAAAWPAAFHREVLNWIRQRVLERFQWQRFAPAHHKSDATTPPNLRLSSVEAQPGKTPSGVLLWPWPNLPNPLV